jgi:hypothetical protein
MQYNWIGKANQATLLGYPLCFTALLILDKQGYIPIDKTRLPALPDHKSPKNSMQPKRWGIAPVVSFG